MKLKKHAIGITMALAMGAHMSSLATPSETLGSWRDSTLKTSLNTYIQQTSDRRSAHFVPQQSRIAVFDVDGTLWVEKPAYPMVGFIKGMANTSSLNKGDLNLIELAGKLSEGMTPEDYQAKSAQYVLTQSHHPRFSKSIGQLVYQPMLELIDNLQQHGYQVYLCSGSDAGFLRAVSKVLFNVEPENVIAQAINYQLVEEQGKLRTVRGDSYRLPINLGKGKVSNIINHIGQTPILAFGNSLGDREMLKWVAAEDGLALMLVHDDAQREYDYGDKNSKIQAAMAGGKVQMVSVKQHFKRIFN